VSADQRPATSRPSGGGSAAFPEPFDFTRVYLALMNGSAVWVIDQEGREGEVVTMAEGDAASRTPPEVGVLFRSGYVGYTSQRAGARLRVSRITKARR